MEDLESELHGVMLDELAWYRDRAVLAQAIKEVAREALLDVVAETIQSRYSDQLRSVIGKEALHAFQADEYRKLLQRDDRRSLIKEATHRALRLEIKRSLETPESADQLDLPWNHD